MKFLNQSNKKSYVEPNPLAKDIVRGYRSQSDFSEFEESSTEELKDRPPRYEFVRGVSETILMYKKPKRVSLEKHISNETKLVHGNNENGGLEHNQLNTNLKHVQTIEAKLKKFDMTL